MMKNSGSIENGRQKYTYREVPPFSSEKKMGSENRELKRSFYELGSMKKSFREIDLRGSSVRY